MSRLSYLQLIRLPGLFTVVANIAAAHTIGTENNTQWTILVLSVLASAALYHSGMVFNDLYDYEEDRLSRPERPLPSGNISLAKARKLAIALMSTGLLLAFFTGTRQLIAATVLAVLILLYDRFTKKSAAGPLTMAACRYTNWLFGLSVVPLTASLSLIALPVFLYTFALTVLSRQETLAEDRRPLGLTAVGIICCAAVLLYNTRAESLILIGAITGLLSTVLLYRVWDLRQNYNTTGIQAMVSVLILGMIPLDALILASQGYIIAALGTLLLLIPGRLVAQRIYIT